MMWATIFRKRGGGEASIIAVAHLSLA